MCPCRYLKEVISMHISEGVLSAPVLITGAIVSVGGLAMGIKSLNMENIPRAAIMAAVFFCGSFIHVNIGPSSMHLVLNGIIGILMGWAAFPSVCVALLLQGLLFQFGGLTTLGINTMNVALPAVACGAIFHTMIKNQANPLKISLTAGAVGALSVAITGLMAGLSLFFSSPEYKSAAYLIVAYHIPVMIVEALVTFACVRFLFKVEPSIIIKPAPTVVTSNV